MFYVERHGSAMEVGRTGRCLAELSCFRVWVSPEQKPTGWAGRCCWNPLPFLTAVQPALRGREGQAHHNSIIHMGNSCASTERCLQRLSLFRRLHCHIRCCKKQAFQAQSLLYTENVLCDNKRTSSTGRHFSDFSGLLSHSLISFSNEIIVMKWGNCPTWDLNKLARACH